MEGVHSEIVGEAASCSVVVPTNEQEWNGVWIVGLLTKELKEDLIGCEQEQWSSDDYRASNRRDGG